MRFVVVLALLGAAFAAHPRPSDFQKNVQESSFRSGREYRYVFDGQLSAGLPLPTTLGQQQQGATRLQAHVALQMLNDKTAVMQLTRVSFATAADLREPRSLQPLSVFEEVRMEKEHKSVLALPVEFNYRHGMVSELRFSEDDQAWSENIKRAVINMLQVNILKKGQTEMEKYHGSEQNEESKSFVSIERTLEGECEVFYTQQPLVESHKDQQQWTKSINFDKCTQRPEIRHVQVPVCEDCESTLADEKMSSSVFAYNVSGTPESFLIHSAELKSQHMFAPLNERQQLLAAFAHNKLELIYAGAKETEMIKVRGERVQQLIYNNEWELAEERFAQTGEEKHLRQLPQWGNKLEMAEKMFAQMAKQVEEGVTLETAHHVSRIVKILRVANEEEVAKLHRAVVALSAQHSEKTADHMRDIFYNCLALAGTRVTVHQLAERIQEQRTISPVKAAAVLKSLVDLRTPSKEIAEELMRICESDAAASSPVLRQSCHLTYGAVVNGFCGRNEHRQFAEQDAKKMCPRELKEKIVRQLVENFKSATTRYEKTLALKTIANAAIDISVFDLETIIVDQTEEKTIRVQAIEALRRLTKTMPRKIQQILMPVFKSRQQPVQVRMSALHQILRTQPEVAVLSQVAQQIKQERSQQVRVFAVSMLRSFANNESPCQKTFAAQVQRILAALPELESQTYDSRFAQWSVYSQRYQSGLDFNWAALFTNESILPNDVMASIDSVFAGEWNEYAAQLGLSQQNIDKVIRQLVNKVQESGIEQIVVRGKRSAGFRPADLLQGLLEKLRISRRSQNADEPHALLYARFRGIDFAFVPFDIESVPEFVKSMVSGGKLEIGDIERMLAQGTHFHTAGAFFGYESIRRVPTALGMPVEMVARMPTVATVQGHVKFELEPKNGQKINGVRMSLQMQPKIASTHLTSLTIQCPIAQSGAKLLHQAVLDTPIDTQLLINWEDKFVMKTITKAPREQRTIVHLQTRPVTFTRVWSSESRQYPEPIEITIQKTQKSNYLVSNINREYFASTGVKMTVSGSVHRPLFPTESHMPKPLLIANNDLDITIEPTEDAPKEYETLIEIDVFQPATLEQPKLDKYFKQQEKQNKNGRFLEVENDDYDQDERNVHLRNYVKSVKSFDKAYKHRITFEAKTSGHAKQHLVKAVATATCDKRAIYCKTILEVRRQPIDDAKEWELKATIQHLYPETPKSIKEMSEQKNRDFVAVAELQWGEDKTNEMNVHVQARQSREQREWLKRLERKELTQVDEQEKLAEAGRLNQYHVVADYKMSKHAEQVFAKIFTAAQLATGNIWNVEHESVDNEEGRMRAQLTVEPRTRRVANLTVETAGRRVVVRDMRLPFALPTAQIHYKVAERHQQRRHFVEKVAQRVAKNAECVVKSQEVRTFDEVAYTAPITPCYAVLAKDCSSKRPEFVVLMKQVKKGSELKNVKVIYGEDEVELEIKSGRLVATLNGKTEEYDDKINNNVDDDKETDSKITLNWHNEKMVKVETDAVSVQFDGHVARVHLNALYKNQQCGLCGHYDNDRENEFRGADNLEKEDLQEFVKSYLYNDDKCDMDDEVLAEKTNFRRIGESSSSEEEEENNYDDVKYEKKSAKKTMNKKNLREQEQEPEQQTLIEERQHQTCFTVEPQPTCGEQTQPMETRKQKVAFVCVPSSASQTRRMVREARRQPLTDAHINKLREQDKSNERELFVQLPKQCEPVAEFNY